MNKGEENHHLLGPYDEPGIILDYSHILSHLNLTANVEKQKREHVVPSSKTWKWFDLQDVTQVVVEKADSSPDTCLYRVCAFFNPTSPTSLWATVRIAKDQSIVLLLGEGSQAGLVSGVSSEPPRVANCSRLMRAHGSLLFTPGLAHGSDSSWSFFLSCLGGINSTISPTCPMFSRTLGENYSPEQPLIFHFHKRHLQLWCEVLSEI